MRALASLGELLFPRKCVLCMGLLKKNETDFCTACRAKAPVFPGSTRSFPYVAEWTAVWLYEDMVRSSLLRFKFRGKQSYAAAYGRMLAMELQKAGMTFDLLTWVPVSARRRFRRGYDQVGLLAGALGRELGIKPRRTLRKVRHTPAQSTLSGAEQRKANVLGAYRVVTPRALQGKRVLLLDDIITTGATLSECARTLEAAGAARVLGASVAAGRNRTK